MFRSTATWCLALVLLLTAAGPQALATSGKSREPADLLTEDCRRITTRAERAYRIPAQLLSAISMAESGHWHEGEQARVAWPWTVYAEGKGVYHPDKASARRAIKRLRARGVSNIDVGCMQINIYHHGKAFRDLDQMLDPHRNVDYAAQFLSRLHGRHRSWSQAVAHYHSATEKYNKPYRTKVMSLWHRERREHDARRRARAQREYLERRERLRREREQQLTER